MGSHAEAWLVEDESAREMLDRVLTERPFLLLHPLHRVPLRVGNIVELVGPSSSAKTHILMQAAITCILPSEWKGINYGGVGHLAMFLDLDCRFDILRFSELLNHRIMEAANGSSSKVDCQKKESEAQNATMKPYNEELFALCMRRFLYIRCYDSSEFLATLKTLHYRIQKEREAHGVNILFLLIDRKSLDLQSVSETVVQEIRKLLLVHPMLVMATKVAILGNRNYRKWSATDNPHSRNVTSSDQQLPYREYMPAVWQSFITHRILVQTTEWCVGSFLSMFIGSLHQLVPCSLSVGSQDLLDWVLNYIQTKQIGNCVGAANHPHFIAFLFSAVFSTIYVSLMSAYAGLHIWPPIKYRSLVHLNGFSSDLALRAIKEVTLTLLSSTVQLSARGLVLVYLFVSSVSVEIGSKCSSVAAAMLYIRRQYLPEPFKFRGR